MKNQVGSSYKHAGLEFFSFLFFLSFDSFLENFLTDGIRFKIFFFLFFKEQYWMQTEETNLIIKS